jgi:hypothetical protein
MWESLIENVTLIPKARRRWPTDGGNVAEDVREVEI